METVRWWTVTMANPFRLFYWLVDGSMDRVRRTVRERRGTMLRDEELLLALLNSAPVVDGRPTDRSSGGDGSRAGAQPGAAPAPSTRWPGSGVSRRHCTPWSAE